MQDTLRLSVGAPDEVPSHVTARPAKHAHRASASGIAIPHPVGWPHRLGLRYSAVSRHVTKHPVQMRTGFFHQPFVNAVWKGYIECVIHLVVAGTWESSKSWCWSVIEHTGGLLTSDLGDGAYLSLRRLNLAFLDLWMGHCCFAEGYL